MFKPVAAIAAAVACALAATPAGAATPFAGQTFAGVDISGVAYDVTFVDGRVTDAYPGLGFTFTNSSDAFAALDAILARSEVATLDPARDYMILVPYALLDPDTFLTVGAGFLFPRGDYGVPIATDFSGAAYTFATFERVAVPEPAAWMLMLLGFGALGGAVRRRRAPAAAA